MTNDNFNLMGPFNRPASAWQGASGSRVSSRDGGVDNPRTNRVHSLWICSLWIWLIVLAMGATLARAETPLSQRRAYLSVETPVSDDPRRVPVRPGPTGPEGTLVLRGGRIFDGSGAPARCATLVIERNHVKAVLSPEITDWPSNAHVIDVSGMTVLPGLIDLHTHLSRPDNEDPTFASSDAAITLLAAEKLRYYLETGITSVRDMASRGDVPFRLKDAVARNLIPGPRVFPAGLFITGEGGHSTDGVSDEVLRFLGEWRIASGPDDWRLAVREQFHRGADLIKLGSHFTREEITAAVDEAHALGLKVAVDAETFYIRWAVDAGADVIEHPLPRDDATITLMAKRGIAADPTLVPYIIIFDQFGGYYGSTSRRFTFSKEANFAMLRRLRKAGVICGIGTDLVGAWYRYLPTAYLTELQEFAAAGWTLPEVLIAATRTNAEILDMGDRLGTLTAGKLADVLVVAGEPDHRLEDLLRVEFVIRDGNLVVEHGRVSIPRHVGVSNWVTDKLSEHF